MSTHINGNFEYSSSKQPIVIKAEYKNSLAILGVSSIKNTNINIPTLTVTNPNGVPAQSIRGNVLSGRVSFTTGIDNLAGSICSIAFTGDVRENVPNVYITPYNCTAMTNNTYLYVNDVTVDGFGVFDIGVALDNTTYSFSYLVIDSY